VHFFSLVFGFVFMVLLLLASLAFAIFRTIKGSGKNRSEESEDEARIIQQLHQQLTRMEERIESLETILLERDKKEEG
jgi:phage shock protein B